MHLNIQHLPQMAVSAPRAEKKFFFFFFGGLWDNPILCENPASSSNMYM